MRVREAIRKDWPLLVAAGIVAGLAFMTTQLPVPAERIPGPRACWVEDKPDGTAERLCGSVKLAPEGAHSFSDNVPEEDEPAFDCKADGNGFCGPVRDYPAPDTNGATTI